MKEVYDIGFLRQVEQGVPLDELERRLRPRTDLEYEELERRVDAGEFTDHSEEGFLGTNESLLRVIHADEETVRRYDTTHEEIAVRLEEAIRTRTVPSNYYMISNGRIVTLGHQTCPWKCQERYDMGNGIVLIGPSTLTEEEKTNILVEAMFGKEEAETIYRANPEVLIKALNLT